MAHHRHNRLNDNDDDESANSEPGLQVHARAQIPFDEFVNAMDVQSDEDEDYAASPIQQSSDDDHQSIYSASGDEEIRNAQWLPRLRTRLDADGDASSLSESETETETVPGIKRRRLLEDESEDNKEKSDSDSISPQDTETKQWLQKLAPVLGKGERHNKKAAIRLVSSRINQKPKDYDALCPELDEDHIKALRERSRVDLTPFNIVMPPRIVDGERSPQIGGLVRNLVAAQRTGIMAVEAIFKKGKEEAAERVLDMFELVSQATGEAQQLRKQNINFRSNQFSYNRSPVSAALSPKDKKAWKENKSISMNTSRSLSRKGGSSRSPAARGRSFSRGRRSRGASSRLEISPTHLSASQSLVQQQGYSLLNVPDAVGARLQWYKAKWEEIGASQILIEGAQANWKDVEAPEQLMKRLKSQEFQGTEEEKRIYIEALQEEIQQGVVTRIPREEVLFLNRTFVIPKKDGRKRKILDCRQVNKYLQDISFKGEDFKKVANITLRGDWATVLDISSAYNHIKVSEELQKYLAFTFAKETYTYIGMPFGLKTAPYIFHKHLHPAITLLRKEGIRMIVYFDDILILAQNPDLLVLQTQRAKQLLESLGWIISPKSMLIPQQQVQYIGWIW
ncbi:MAG: putative Transposon Ty3-G Gag-Pol polyprotein, partial [Streblomastix strix]